METENNETLDTIFSHCSIRDFKDVKLGKEQLDLLFKTAFAASTSTGTQACSIINVTDGEIKEKISKVCQQEFIAKAPHLFIFVVDLCRNKHIVEESGLEKHFADSMDLFFQGFSDACISAQNMVVAAQSMGLGICYLGSILNDPTTICDLLHLPTLTFPVVGLVLGVPDGSVTCQKPRLDTHFRVFENSYEEFDEYLPKLVGYNKQMEDYYAKRGMIAVHGKYPNDFSKLVVVRLKRDFLARRKIMEFIRKQGFDLELD